MPSLMCPECGGTINTTNMTCISCRQKLLTRAERAALADAELARKREEAEIEERVQKARQDAAEAEERLMARKQQDAKQELDRTLAEERRINEAYARVQETGNRPLQHQLPKRDKDHSSMVPATIMGILVGAMLGFFASFVFTGPQEKSSTPFVISTFIGALIGALIGMLVGASME